MKQSALPPKNGLKEFYEKPPFSASNKMQNNNIFLRRKKDLEKEGRYSKKISFDHGRQEIREYYAENDIGWLRKNHPGWEGLNGIGACISTVTERNVTTTSVSYSIYSRAGMDAEEYGKHKRSHWGAKTACIGY